ncbi:DUF2846 domain-containing protein [Pedobacter gandavensis]|uniref:DUF2846 domain-containing protein n=1 Tax=Pedobacter gandavensis TaxID=2679963 RepID=A0ABR6ER45_9SPHI|nr:DUF2846 domain-containing protein [Pedobacter gandavensis]MBB2147507.1 DUF2846 domain-containing protein [Pedobacter gandavensis]
MKSKILTSLFVAVIAVCLFTAFKSQETGKVYFIRSTNYVGTLVNNKVYIDDKLVCHLKNNHYSVHTIEAGEHTVSVSNTGLGSHAKSRPVKINVVANKNNYLMVVNGKQLSLQELVESSAQDLLKKVVETKDCSPAK